MINYLKTILGITDLQNCTRSQISVNQGLIDRIKVLEKRSLDLELAIIKGFSKLDTAVKKLNETQVIILNEDLDKDDYN